MEGKQEEDEPELCELERSHREAVTDEEDDDMSSQLNPDAKEFVPTSPQRTSPHSPFSNGSGSLINRQNLLMDDELLAQSPRKGVTPLMDDFALPSENDFSEISKCPAEVAGSLTETIENGNGYPSLEGDENRPGSSSSQCSYQEMNLKEAMHGDEKQEFAAEIVDTNEAVDSEPLSNNDQSIDFHVNVAISESDPMNMSFYKEQNNPFSVGASDVDMNAVQRLPEDSGDEMEDKPSLSNLVNNEFLNDEDFHVQRAGALENGSHFVIQDTEFGMSQHADEISKPEEDMYSPVSETRIVDELSSELNGLNIETVQPTVTNESNKPESELVADPEVTESSSIAQVVQELATQVTSVLNDFSDLDNDHAAASPKPEDLFSQEHVISAENNSGFASDFNEFSSANQLLQKAVAFNLNPESEPKVATDIDVLTECDQVLREEVSTPSLLGAEPKIAEQVVPHAKQLPVIDNQQESNVEIIAAASVAAVTAVAAAAATVALKAAPSAKAKVDPKKPEVKARTSGVSTAPAAKKPAAAPLKSTRPLSSTASKSATSPTKAAPTKAVPATRTIRAVPAKAPVIEKKTSTTTTATAAAKKPLTNGTTTGVRKPATTSTLTKPASTGARPLVATTKTAAARANLGTTSAPSTARTSTLTSRTTTSTVAPKVAPIAR